ncbi:MAG: DnaJ domain-containing protein [Calothrix sp. MO_167.B42]|nr:DnaJ domain-containing protein [Calothrix sp. MO_167.B42]
MTHTSPTAATFITTGTVTGASVSATVGGMGLAGGFGAVGIGTVPTMGAGAVAGAAVYGAFKGIGEGDTTAFASAGIGAVGGVIASNFIGGMGVVAPKVGLALGIGTVSMTAVGAVVGLAGYGIAKLLDESGVKETPTQVFERMEAKVSYMEDYSSAVLELEAFLSGEDINQKFAALEIESELQKLKQQVKQTYPRKKFPSSPTVGEKKRNKSRVGSKYHRKDKKPVNLTHQQPEPWRCVKTIKQHSAAVNAIAISSNGKIFVTGSNDATVNLWDLHTGKWLHTFAGQAEAVLSVAISPNGKTLASGCVDCKISSWNLETKTFHQTFFDGNSPYSHNGFVNSITFSADGKFLASGSADKTVRIWRCYTGQLKRTLNGHSGAVLSVVFSPDGKTVVSGSVDKTIRIWDLHSFGEPQTITGHLDAVTTVAIREASSLRLIAPNGNILVSASQDSTIKLWNLHTGELISTFTEHSAPITSIAITPNGQILASSSIDGTIKLWNFHNGKLLQTLSGCSSVVFSPDSKTLLTGSRGGRVKIWQQMWGIDESQNEFTTSGEWWEVLGVHPDTCPRDVKNAYRRLARKYHPDVNHCATAPAAMQAINHSYQEFWQKIKRQ